MRAVRDAKHENQAVELLVLKYAIPREDKPGVLREYRVLMAVARLCRPPDRCDLQLIIVRHRQIKNK